MENTYSRRYWLEKRIRELELPFDMMEFSQSAHFISVGGPGGVVPKHGPVEVRQHIDYARMPVEIQLEIVRLQEALKLLPLPIQGEPPSYLQPHMVGRVSAEAQAEIDALLRPYTAWIGGGKVVHWAAVPKWIEEKVNVLRLKGETEAVGANKFDGFSTEDMEAEITRRKKANEIERVHYPSNSVTQLNEHNHDDYKLVQPLLSWYEGRQQNPVTVTVQTGVIEHSLRPGDRWTYRRPK